MIKRIKWKNHCSLGNLELDFSRPDGTPYNTIILAGENGTGKTTILNTLSEFLNGGSIQPFEFIDYVVSRDSFHIIPLEGHESFGYHTRFENGESEFEQILTNKYNNPDQFKNDSKDIRSYGFSYSKARSGFNTERVTSITTQQIDVEKYEPDEKDNFTKIKQLLVDIEQQDDALWRQETENGGLSDAKYQDFINHRSKGHRFEEAFNGFFDKVKYSRVDNDDVREKRILFKKHSIDIPIDELSTGEKQIVFRGAHLLKSLMSITGGIVMIDEPELSLHPLWQKKILQFYRGLFTNDGNQSVQILIATHSEYILQTALNDSDVLIVSLHDDNGVIESKQIVAPSALPTLTAAETNYLVFGVLSVDYHIQLYGYLQNKEMKYTVKECDSFISSSSYYNPAIHYKPDSYKSIKYQTLPTFIRNAIDHPGSSRSYTEEELRQSIELLINLCK